MKIVPMSRMVIPASRETACDPVAGSIVLWSMIAKPPLLIAMLWKPPLVVKPLIVISRPRTWIAGCRVSGGFTVAVPYPSMVMR